MSEVTIKYNGNNIATMDSSGTKTLKTRAKYCESDIEIDYARPSGTVPSGTVNITTNGVTNVTQYANANVNVSAATAFGTHNGWKIAKFFNINSDIGNGSTCNIDTGISNASRFMVICMDNTARTTWGLQAAHFSPSAYNTAGCICLKPSSGQMYGQSTSYISNVSYSGTTLSFTVANGNSTVRAGEYLLLYK